MYIVAGLFKNRKLKTPKGEATRPTSSRLRETVFNMCQTYIEGACFLDIFAGSGAMGLEAMSRGAHSSVFIDSNREAISCISYNIEQLALTRSTQVIIGDVFQQLEKLEKTRTSFDIIYADPPYETYVKVKGMEGTYGCIIIETIDNNKLLKPGGTLFIEEAAGFITEDKNWKTLILKSFRQTGKAVLYEFKKSRD